MHIVLAWCITFNFINISWVFFRAKDFGDALKVLKGMFFGEFMLPDKYMDKLGFLSDFGVTFGRVFEQINGKDKTIYFILGAFLVVLAFKNSSYYTKNFKATKLYMVVYIVMSVYALFNIHKLSEFLYFNF
jgi:hypothetical protein